MTAEPTPQSALFVISTVGQWEIQTRDVAASCGIKYFAVSSLTRFLEAAGRHHGPACVFVDLTAPDIDWVNLRELMLEHSLEIPVVIVADEIDFAKACEVARCCASFVITRPVDAETIGEAIDAALNNQKVVDHQFAVERNYRRLLTLDERERSIVDLAVDGAPNKQIANRLGLSVKTIERIRKNAYRKLDVRSTAEMTRAVILGGLHDIVYTNGPPVLAGTPSLPSSQLSQTATLSGSST